MTELIEKTSYEARLGELRQITSPYFEEDHYNSMPGFVAKLERYIAKEVELAYKAGMLHFNAFDHTLSDPRLLKPRFPWSSPRGQDMETEIELGPGAELPSLYLQAKGFKK